MLRDFILSRRVGGVQQITEVLNVHSYGNHVLYPYGYTKEDVPSDMTADDHATFVALAKKMASLNGYKAMQGSQMYIYDGDFIDWAYGDQHIFAFTWEMYPRWGCKCGGFHPPDAVIARETSRNANAALYLLRAGRLPVSRGRTRRDALLLMRWFASGAGARWRSRRRGRRAWPRHRRPCSGLPAAVFPSGFTGYHDYAEMMADINCGHRRTTRASWPSSPIGQSYEGRTIWAVKISDNVGTDENEPEVLFEHLHHAREHLAVEAGARDHPSARRQLPRRPADRSCSSA